MHRNLTISLSQGDTGRIVAVGELITASNERVKAAVAFCWRAARADVSEAEKGIVDIFVFRREALTGNEAEVQPGEAPHDAWKELLDYLHQEWRDGNADTFGKFSSQCESVAWNIFETPEMPVKLEIRDTSLIDRKNRLILEQKNSIALIRPFYDALFALEKKYEGMTQYIHAASEELRELKHNFSKTEESGHLSHTLPMHLDAVKERLHIFTAKIVQLKTEEESRNSAELSPKVVEAVRKARISEDFKTQWEELKALQEGVKTKLLSHDAAEALRDMLHEAFETLKQRQHNFNEHIAKERAANYEKMKPLVDACKTIATEAVRFSEARDHIKAVQGQLKGLKLTRDHHDELKEVITEAFKLLWERESTYFSERDKESTSFFEILKPLVDTFVAKVDQTDRFKEAFDELKALQEKIKESKLNREHGNELRQSLSAAFETLKKRRDEYHQDYEKNTSENFAKFSKLVNRAVNEAKTHKNLNEAFDKLKEWQQELFAAKPLKKEQREELTLRMQDAFKELHERRKSYFDQKHAEWKAKQEDFIDKMRIKKDRLISLLEIQTGDAAAEISARIEELTKIIEEASAKIAKASANHHTDPEKHD